MNFLKNENMRVSPREMKRMHLAKIKIEKERIEKMLFQSNIFQIY